MNFTDGYPDTRHSDPVFKLGYGYEYAKSDPDIWNPDPKIQNKDLRGFGYPVQWIRVISVADSKIQYLDFVTYNRVTVAQ